MFLKAIFQKWNTPNLSDKSPILPQKRINQEVRACNGADTVVTFTCRRYWQLQVRLVKLAEYHFNVTVKFDLILVQRGENNTVKTLTYIYINIKFKVVLSCCN